MFGGTERERGFSVARTGGVQGVAAHQVQIRLGAASRQSRGIGGAAIRAAAESAIPTGVSAVFLLAACRASLGWGVAAAAIGAAFLAHLALGVRSRGRTSGQLRELA